MFERYTERARRVIFFARYEASQYGSMTIETEHLLLGVIREDKNLIRRFSPNASPEEIRVMLERHMSRGPKTSTSLDLPLTDECKHILAFASEEAEGLNHRFIGTEHVVLGMLREEKCAAARVLVEIGLNLEVLRGEVAGSEPDKGSAPPLGQRMQEFLQRRAGALRRDPSGKIQEGRSSFSREEDGFVVVESHQFHQGHQVSLTERFRMSEDGKKLLYSLEILGPRTDQQHKHSMEFDVS